MSDTDGTCEYVLDPDDPDTWGGEEEDECYVGEELLNEDGVWTCPYDSQESEDLCIFHLPVEEKDNEQVVSAVFNTLDEAANSHDSETQKRRLQFIGAKFGAFDLSENPREITAEDTEIHLTHGEFSGRIDLSNSIFDISRIDLRGVRCASVAIFSNTEFGGEMNFKSAKFGDRTSFRQTKFREKAIFLSAEFSDVIHFEKTKFENKFIFSSAVAKKVCFREAEFNGEASFSGAKFNGGADFTEATFKEGATFGGIKFEKDADFVKAAFGGRAYFWNGEFGGEANFPDVTFKGEADFSEAEFWETSDFIDVEFDGEVSFKKAEFTVTAPSTFRRAVFRGEADFAGADFRGEADFGSVEFRAETRYRLTEFRGKASFSGTKFWKESDFSEVKFEGEAAPKSRRLGGDGDFKKIDFWGRANFFGTEFEEGVDFSESVLTETDFGKSDLTDARFTSASMQNVNLESALLSRATLFGANLCGAKLNGALLGDVRVNEDTNFLGHPSDNTDSSPHTFSAIRSRPTCVYDPDYEEDNEHADVDKAKSVYRALEELGGKHARPRLQARSFVRRQDLQKNDYWDDATADDASLEERLIAGARWSRAKMARATLLYGESPWRVIAWSLGIIFSFALLYPLGGWMKPTDGDPITYVQIASNPVEILNSVYYSTLTYTALGFGDFQPVGLGRLLTTVETGLGAVMLALLVFILGRRAAR